MIIRVSSQVNDFVIITGRCLLLRLLPLLRWRRCRRQVHDVNLVLLLLLLLLLLPLLSGLLRWLGRPLRRRLCCALPKAAPWGDVGSQRLQRAQPGGRASLHLRALLAAQPAQLLPLGWRFRQLRPGKPPLGLLCLLGLLVLLRGAGGGAGGHARPLAAPRHIFL
jgi:hypothetical protein